MCRLADSKPFRLRLAGSLFVLVILAPSASADEREEKLPDEWRKWLKEEVVYIISDVEREAFLNLENETERQAFANAFWRKRDTNPTTPENEYKIEHYERLEYANKFLGRDTFRPGWMTDRGRYHILLGPPNTVQNFDHDDNVYPVELWFYNDSKLKELGLPPYFYLLFFRRHGGGELELYSPAVDGPQSLLTGYQTVSMDRTDDVERAYYELFEIHPELAHASLSFRTDEGDTAQFMAPDFGTISLLDSIIEAPFRGVDTSYAERFDLERSLVESDYLFAFVPSYGMTTVLPGPGDARFLHWVIEVDPQHVAVVHDQDRDLYGAVFIYSMEVVSREDPDKIVVETRKESFLRLTDAQVARGSLSGPYAFRGMTPLVPGAYDVRVILRNRACPGRDEEDCVKSYTLLESQVEVSRGDASAPELSEIVLAYATERPSGEPAYRPYRLGAVELHPNPRRTYAIGDRLVAAVEPRNAPGGAEVRFRVFGEDAASILFENTLPSAGLRFEPIIAELDLGGFEGGNYRLVAELVHDGGEVLASRSAEFQVTPRTRVDRPMVRGVASSIAPEIPGAVATTLGEQYLKLEQKDEARREFETAVRANPKLGPAREALAALEMEAGNTASVIELLEPVYREIQDRYVILALLGEAYFREKKHAKAIELLGKAIELRRPDYQLLNFLAASHYQLGHTAEAKKLLERSLEIHPNQPEVKELLDELAAAASKDVR